MSQPSSPRKAGGDSDVTTGSGWVKFDETDSTANGNKDAAVVEGSANNSPAKNNNRSGSSSGVSSARGSVTSAIMASGDDGGGVLPVSEIQVSYLGYTNFFTSTYNNDMHFRLSMSKAYVKRTPYRRLRVGRQTRPRQIRLFSERCRPRRPRRRRRTTPPTAAWTTST